MRILVADCSAVYSGRLNASLPPAKRVLLVKADNSLLIFSELGSYKPLNWMSAPCTIRETDLDPASDAVADDAATSSSGDPDPSDASDEPRPVKRLRVTADKTSDVLDVTITHVYSDQTFDLGQDPGLVKDGVEDHLQHYLAEQIERIGDGAKLVRREYPTAIGPVDIMAVNAEGEHVAIEIKRHGGIDGVEQLTRYCELLNRDPLLAPVHGIFAAQTITPQARVLAEDRGFTCLILDYEEMKGTEDDALRLF
ncbi:endonuclease NucS [Bifidobacterium sp. CP2]|uniref:endonuclease NucS n=1 Tax=Bifidobacterium TaxID=1678 RepID=UPI001BDD1EDE|nr:MULTISPECIES: endonuclease NucS [Bifidobacterium]MBT1181712.1 endonuclease NucS [Bifidobacterium sp. CP2]MBW3081285.1 endonuclease NucS [Bifidobacterium saguinibicoloris]